MHDTEQDQLIVFIFPVLATLTSYSENADRSGKHSDASRLKLRQAGKSSGGDSFLYRVDENMAASTYSLNKIPERSLEHSGSHSAHSIPLYLMPRPNSVAGKFELLHVFYKIKNGSQARDVLGFAPVCVFQVIVKPGDSFGGEKGYGHDDAVGRVSSQQEGFGF